MSEQRWRVLVSSKSFGQAFPEHLTQLATSGFEVMPNGVGGRAYLENELHVALHGVHIITGTDELTADVIARADSLRLIAKHGVGLETTIGEITIENCCRVRDGQEALYRFV